MTEIRFYHMRRDTAEKTVPDLLGKALAHGHKVLLKLPDATRRGHYDDWLWRYRDDAFLPHAQDGDQNPQAHPIWLSTDNDAPNGATMALAVEGAELPPVDQFKLVCLVFSSENESELARSRVLWKELKQQESVALTYWQQQDNGTWEKQNI
jgi:DNA polymerase III subunit chi